MTPHYLAAARLLVQAAPLVFADDTFALKGGTAINLFVRDMPRLSVDLDLVLADGRASRDEALARIAAALKVAENRLHHHGFVVRLPRPADGVQTKLFARRDGAEVKVEVNHVMRGTMQPVRRAALVRAAREALKADIALPMLTDDELYAGKLVAALDRQHPRDLYDVMQLYAHGGIPPAMRQNFVAYLACHNRPVHEVLFATKKDIAFEFERSFAGMTAEPVALDALLQARDRLMRELPASLGADERAFLVSLAHGAPDWARIPIPHLAELPAMRWKIENLQRLAVDNPKKLAAQAREIKEKFRNIA